MFLEWSTRGTNLWAIEEVAATLTAAADTFTLGAGSIDLMDFTVSISGTDYWLSPIGRDDYVAISNKAQTGRPTQYWVEKTLPWPTVHLYPVPDTSYSATYHRLRQLQDISAYTQTADAPALFLEAICAGLAARIALKWVKDDARRQELKALALAAYNEAFHNDRERAPFRLVPDLTGWGW